MNDVVGAIAAKWTDIAVRTRWVKYKDAPNPWFELPDAPMTLEQARQKAEGGWLFKALRYTEDDVFVVIKRRTGAPT